MSLSIRPARESDLEIIVEFNRLLAWESENLNLDPDVLIEGVRACLMDSKKGFYSLAERRGQIVGQTLITFEWSDWRNGWFWWIQSVFVHPDARRLGVFRSLFQHVQSQAASDPTVIGIRLYMDHHNERARMTYQNMGLCETEYRLLEQYPLPGRLSHTHK